MKTSIKSRVTATIAAAGIAAGALFAAAPADAAMNNATRIYYDSFSWCLDGADIEKDYEGWTKDFYKGECKWDPKRKQYYRIIGYNVI
ncbi:MAG: hypothetical protein ACTHZ5_00535 [Micrococcaceae bacterium]